LNARPPIAATLAVLLLAGSPAAQAQAFRCQYEDGHVEFRQGTCPFGTKALNVQRPNLRQAASSAPSVAVTTAPVAAASAPIYDLGPDGQPPVTWGLVDVDYRGVTVRTLFDRMAGLVGKKAMVDASVANRVVVAQYHDVPWDEAVADIAGRAGLDVRDQGATLAVKPSKH
jgi:hypothetical protein